MASAMLGCASKDLTQRLSAANPRMVLWPGPKQCNDAGSSASEPVLKLLVLVGVHGNEQCGLRAMNELLSQRWFDQPDHCHRIELVALVGNPQAVLKNKRFMEKNLNRIIAPRFWQDESLRREHAYESERAQEVAAHVSRCDFFLDLHSTSSTSPSFALPVADETSQRLARALPVDAVVFDLAHNTQGGGTSLDYAKDHTASTRGVCVECGQHIDPVSTLTAKEVIKAFVRTCVQRCHRTEEKKDCNCNWDVEAVPGSRLPCQAVMRSQHSVVVGKNFKFARRFQQFEFVEYGELVCSDDSGETRCPYAKGAHVIMPARMPFQGEEAFFWGEVVDGITSTSAMQDLAHKAREREKSFHNLQADMQESGVVVENGTTTRRRRRRIIGIAGCPGAGKSTLAARYVAEDPNTRVLVPMDGFHLANEQLRRLGLADRKGAPDTFDVDGYVALLERLRHDDDDDDDDDESTTHKTVYAPRFDRSIEESLAGAIAVQPHHTTVVTEGNYLLHDSLGWEKVRALLHECWYIEIDDKTRVERLVARHIAHGRSASDAAAWVRDVDERNARLIRATKDGADVIVRAGEDGQLVMPS